VRYLLAGTVAVGVGAVVSCWLLNRRSFRRQLAVLLEREAALWVGLDSLVQRVAQVQKFEGDKTSGWVREVIAETEAVQYFLQAAYAPITQAEIAASRGRFVRASHALRDALDLVDRADLAWFGAEENWSLLDEAFQKADESKTAAHIAQTATYTRLTAERERTGWLLEALATQVLAIDEQHSAGLLAHQADPVGAFPLLQAVIDGYDAVTRSLTDLAPTQALLTMQQAERQRIATFVQDQERRGIRFEEGSPLEALERSLSGEEQAHLDLAYGAVALAHEALTVAVHSVTAATALIHRYEDAPKLDEQVVSHPDGCERDLLWGTRWNERGRGR
jgi:hypothetical protein